MRLFDGHKRQIMSYAKTAGIAALFLVVAVPFAKKLTTTKASTGESGKYLVVLNGEELGYVDDESVANAALLDARTQIKAESDSMALVEADIELYEEDVNEATISREELSNTIYTTLSSDVVVEGEEAYAYTVRIDDFTVTLSSKEEVSELLEKVKDKYSENNEFTVELVEDNSKAYTALKTNIVSADVEVNEAAKVLASASSSKTNKEDTEEEITYTDGVLSVDFEENIEVIPTRATDDVVTVDEAYELITKEHATKGTYTVKSGDTLIGIADKCGITLDELYELNYGFSDDMTLYVGDVVTVTVPASEISVVVVEETSYTEKYSADVVYVDNDSLYVGTENVLEEGTEGKRSVVALVTYVNGVESEREIIKEDVIKEATPTKIERGTLEPPTYIKPVYSTTITSEYGYRIHPINGTYSLHSGVDWYVPQGTSVRAAAGGTVITAGWNGGYGYCVDIQHSDGSMTRYAHLSQVLVSYGQTVTQGTVVGLSGSTGNSTGPHLHFEIYINGCSVNPVDYVGR